MAADTMRDRAVVRDLTDALSRAAEGIGPVTIMHVCGTHEHELRRYGIRQLLPANVKLIAGPGCPVCITPASAIATVMAIARHDSGPVVCTYGDMVRVPTDNGSLYDLRGEGCDVRVVYSIRDAVSIARALPDRNVVFFSVGFETTAAPVAATIRAGIPGNLLVYTCHRYVPPAVEALAGSDDGLVNGYLLPGHATVITGTGPYNILPERYGRASAVGGFEPVEMLVAGLSILRQIRAGKPEVANCYAHVVRDGGNPAAMKALDDVFDRTDAPWRGIGVLPGTGLTLNEKFYGIDALKRLELAPVKAADVMPGCICHLVLTGKNEPGDCPLFGKACTPDHPHGPCMVSTEGTCRAHFLFPEDIDAV